MVREPYYTPVSPFSAGVTGRCPRCGQGRLFSGFITIAPSCGNCGLDFKFADSGDGPAVFIILILGFIVAGGALLLEVTHQPPYWVHAVVWLPVILILTLVLLRPFKGVLVCLQYANKARQGELDT